MVVCDLGLLFIGFVVSDDDLLFDVVGWMFVLTVFLVFLLLSCVLAFLVFVCGVLVLKVLDLLFVFNVCGFCLCAVWSLGFVLHFVGFR